MDYTKYLDRVNVTGTTVTDQYKYSQQQLINDVFNYASDVYTIKHINSSTFVETNVVAKVDVLFRTKTNTNINTDDYRKIILKDLYYLVNLGDQFEFGGYIWIVIDTENISNLNNSVVVRRCNSVLKFYDSNHVYTEIKAIVSNKLETLEEDKFVVLPDNKLRVIVPYNSKSQQIKLAPSPTRFVLGGNVYATELIDNLTYVKNGVGFLEILLIADQINDNDDLQNGLAYNGYLPKINVEILNGSSASIGVSQTLQLNVKITDNNKIISATPTYSSSNINICTVNSLGLITPVTQGTCTITATYLGVSDTIEITVVAVSENNYTVDIIGSSVIKFGQSLTYNCSFKNNGVVINDMSVWELKADDGISETNLAIIVSQDSINNTCIIKGNSNNLTGFIRLYVRNFANTVSNYLRIEVKTLFG